MFLRPETGYLDAGSQPLSQRRAGQKAGFLFEIIGAPARQVDAKQLREQAIDQCLRYAVGVECATGQALSGRG